MQVLRTTPCRENGMGIREMRDYLGSKGQYYRYKLGQLKLLPEQQKYIKQLFARYGYKDVEFEHFSDEIDFTKI